MASVVLDVRCVIVLLLCNPDFHLHHFLTYTLSSPVIYSVVNRLDYLSI